MSLPLPTEAVLEFWFGAPDDPSFGTTRSSWFAKDPAFDEQVRVKFLPGIEAALAGAFDHVAHAREMLAAIIVLDQFPRNVFRGTARSFEGDSRARAFVHRALKVNAHREIAPVERWFLYMPLMHSEDRAEQRQCVALYDELAAQSPNHDVRKFARAHADIVERFGRFPHRNALLGRASTPEEVEFLKQPGSSF
jgi:uncharacterized protein (DUF924 family)